MNWRTKILNPKPFARTDFRSLSTPIYRGSTVIFDGYESVTDHWEHSKEGYSYGLYGTPTTLELAERISHMENSFRKQRRFSHRTTVALWITRQIILYGEESIHFSKEVSESLLVWLVVTYHYQVEAQFLRVFLTPLIGFEHLRRVLRTCRPLHFLRIPTICGTQC